MLLKRVPALFLCVACGATAAAAQAGARPAPSPARPGAQAKPAPAQRERTPAQQARDEWNRGAVAYRAGRYAEARQHFEKARALDPKLDKVNLYVARSIHQQYRPGVEDAENVARGEEAVAAYEAILAEAPADDDAFNSLVHLLGQMRRPDRAREAVMRRANDASLPTAKRVAALTTAAAADLKCSQEVTERPENKESVKEGERVVAKYKMPADTGEFYRAQQCSTGGLTLVEHAAQFAPEDQQVWMQRANLLRELSKLAEMEGNTGQKDFYESQHAETAERLKAMGVTITVAPAKPAAGEAPAQQDGGTAGRAVSGGVMNSKAVHMPPPEYPAVAKAARASGAVVVRVVVNEEGAVTTAQAVSGHPLLQQAAVDAVRQWRFVPTMLSGQPVKVTGTVTVNFTLD